MYYIFGGKRNTVKSAVTQPMTKLRVSISFGLDLDNIFDLHKSAKYSETAGYFLVHVQDNFTQLSNNELTRKRSNEFVVFKEGECKTQKGASPMSSLSS